MAINYTNLFTSIGKAIQACNYYASTFATMKTNGQEFSQAIVDLNVDSLADGSANAVSGHISGLSAGCSYWQSKVSDILLDSTLVTSHLPITSISLQTVLPALFKDMVTNSQSVLESLTTVGTPSFVGTGNGTLIGLAYLDDISNPVQNPTASNMGYYTSQGDTFIPSQLGIVDTVYAKCISADSEGTEQFQIFGNSAIAPFSEYSEGLGGSISVTTTDANNLLTNGGFETYSGGFTGWTIDDAGGTLVQETSSMYRGASAARINTLANADTVTFSQDLATSLTRGKAYLFGIRIKSVAGETGNNLAGTVELLDGVTNIAGWTLNNISIAGTSWTYARGILVVPFSVDPNNALTLKLSLSPTADGVDGIIFDDAFLVPADYFNGAAYCVWNGSTRFRVGDLFQVNITRSSPGVIQEFFRKTYGVQLPSEVSGDETIADSLAT